MNSESAERNATGQYYQVKVLPSQMVAPGHKPNQPELHDKYAGRLFMVRETEHLRECGCKLLQIRPTEAYKLTNNFMRHYWSECTVTKI